MTTTVDTVNLTNTETVVVQDFYPESVSLTQTERVVERQEGSTVVVTGVLAPASASTISGSGDINVNQLADGAVLVYSISTNKWIATNLLDTQVIEAGQY